ncbi:hypothetical protein BG004_008421 [Podila humilis]|nr:hypothetical protein BG004_008421 [Podila humilis]
MQIKTLVIASLAAAAVSAQDFAKNACTDCVYASFGKDTQCATLPPSEAASLQSVFANQTVNATLLIQLVKIPAVRTCVCHWSTTAFSADGAAGSCMSGAAPVCNASQIGEAKAGIAPLESTILKCGSTPSGTDGTKPSGTGAPAPSGTGADSAASSINIPYAMTVAAFGLVALAGL